MRPGGRGDVSVFGEWMGDEEVAYVHDVVGGCNCV